LKIIYCKKKIPAAKMPLLISISIEKGAGILFHPKLNLCKLWMIELVHVFQKDMS
jgi:hypothetical protein